MQHGTTSGFSEPKNIRSRKVSRYNNGIKRINPLDRLPMRGAPLDFLFIWSMNSHPPKAKTVISLRPKSTHEYGAPAWNTPNSHIAPGTDGIKEITVIKKRGMAIILDARVT